MEPIQDDRQIHDTLISGDEIPEALAALDRLVAERSDLIALFLAEQQGRKRAEAERDRLLAALRIIASDSNGGYHSARAREALTKTTEGGEANDVTANQRPPS